MKHCVFQWDIWKHPTMSSFIFIGKKRMYAKFVTLSICKLLKLLVSIFPFRKLKDCIRTNTLEWMAHVTVATASPPPPPTIDHDIGNRRLNLIYFDRKRVCVCFSSFWLGLLLLATFSLFFEPLIFEGRITECCVFAERKKAAKRPDRHKKNCMLIHLRESLVNVRKWKTENGMRPLDANSMNFQWYFLCAWFIYKRLKRTNATCGWAE